MLRMDASASISKTACCWSKPPIRGPDPSAPWTCNVAALRAKRNRCACTLSRAVTPCVPNPLHCPAGEAEDRATQGCDPSADSVAGKTPGALRAPGFLQPSWRECDKSQGSGGDIIADQLRGHFR